VRGHSVMRCPVVQRIEQRNPGASRVKPIAP
jgi:hypothetical protein